MSQVINQSSKLFRVVPLISRCITTASNGRQSHPQQVTTFEHDTENVFHYQLDDVEYEIFEMQLQNLQLQLRDLNSVAVTAVTQNHQSELNHLKEKIMKVGEQFKHIRDSKVVHKHLPKETIDELNKFVV